MQEDFVEKKQKITKVLGEIVKSHRVAKNKTIYAISAECSMSKSTWREVELALCNDINLSTLWQISEGLDIPIDSLIGELLKKLGKDFTLSELD